MKTKFLLILFFFMSIIACEKEPINDTPKQEEIGNVKVVVHNTDTTGFNIENVDPSIFNLRNGVVPGAFFYLTSLSTDNFWIVNGQNPRKHELFSHSKIDIIYFEKVSSGTIMVVDGNTQVECANYNIAIVYKDGTIEDLAWYIAPYLGENYEIVPTQSLIHASSTARKQYLEATRINPILSPLLYRPQNTVNLAKWNWVIDGVLQTYQPNLMPEDFSSLVWRPKHRL